MYTATLATLRMVRKPTLPSTCATSLTLPPPPARLFLAAFPNLYLGFTGVITYKNASVTRDAVRTVVPLERLLLETDGPNLKPDEAFLLKPEAQAGGKGKGNKRRGRNAVCHPGHIPIVAAAIAAIKGGTTSTEDVLAAAYTNAKAMYGLP